MPATGIDENRRMRSFYSSRQEQEAGRERIEGSEVMLRLLDPRESGKLGSEREREDKVPTVLISDVWGLAADGQVGATQESLHGGLGAAMGWHLARCGKHTDL